MKHPAPTTTHTTTEGKPSKRCEIAQRLGRARAVLDDIETHSDARIRRACKTILNDSRDHAERQLASDLWRMVNDGKTTK
jgi:hypothetical protein